MNRYTMRKECDCCSESDKHTDIFYCDNCNQDFCYKCGFNDESCRNTCPFCEMRKISDRDAYKYLLALYKNDLKLSQATTKTKAMSYLLDQAKDIFDSYNTFSQYLNQHFKGGGNMKSKEYQGWASYETWNVMLFLNNDQNTYNEYRRQVRSFAKTLGNKLLCRHAKAVALQCLGNTTADGVNLNSKAIKWSEIRDAMLESIKER